MTVSWTSDSIGKIGTNKNYRRLASDSPSKNKYFARIPIEENDNSHLHSDNSEDYPNPASGKG